MRRYAAVAVGVLVALGCGRLGVWQLDRLAERRARNEITALRLAAPPIDLTGGPGIAAHDSLHHRRVTATGSFDFDRQVVLIGRSLRGVPGVHVVTPLVVGDRAVLVERGWAPSPDAASVELELTLEDTVNTVVGVLLPPGTRGTTLAGSSWPLRLPSLDPAAIAERFPYPLVGLALRRTDGPATALTPIPLPDLTDGPHLSYAIQWFAFATIALVGGIVLGLREPRTATEGRG